MWLYCIQCGKKRRWKRKSVRPRKCRKCGHLFPNILNVLIEATDQITKGMADVVSAFRRVTNTSISLRSSMLKGAEAAKILRQRINDANPPRS